MKKSLIFACFFFAIVCVVGTTTEAQTYTFNNDLRLGNTGQDVANLQTWLIANGYNIPSISSGANTKGYYGFQTMAAVEAYQTAAGLPAYGFFRPITRAYWSSHYGNGGNQGGNSGTSFRVISPNGGEAWALGTTQNITWTGSSNILNQTGDIKLEHALPACALPGANPRCMIAVLAPQTCRAE